ncbi:MAG: aminotransferase class I/II-fold pyridoxal phosphate-dependent enzyme [Emcibacteraceae bacterium]|nr:aminotransferase class I/II-fold pyridoxal phosphate-dependent enzyme [Emcibacteraceae bacterium]
MVNIIHGGDMKSVQLRFPNVKKTWIDLSTGLNPNPYPWLDKVSPKELETASHKLPQEAALDQCKKVWTEHLNVKNSDEWLLVAGSQAYINLLPRIFSDHHALIVTPNYSEHERVWSVAKNDAQKISRYDLKEYNFKSRSLLILTNPNNPDGHVWTAECLIELADRLDQNDGVLVVDEAFADVAIDNSLSSLELPENIIILRSFGKFFGLGGVRLGMVRLPLKYLKNAVAELGPWSVNGLALSIAEVAYNDKKWINDSLQQLSAKMEQLKRTLLQYGFNIIGTTDLFCLVEHVDASAINNKLNENGICVRVFDEYPTYLRFGLIKDNKQLLRLQEALL